MNIPHPIPYQGSKRQLAQEISRFFPADIEQFIEPFAGSAAISLATAFHAQAKRFILNDINKPLIDLWYDIIEQPEKLSGYYEQLWLLQQGRERHFYDLVRSRFNRTKRAYYLLYLLARCVKASVRYNSYGEFNQSPDNRRLGRHPKKMRQDILIAASLLRGRTTLMSDDYQSLLNLAASQDLIYLDPPYQGVSRSRDPRYLQGVLYEQFVDFLSELNRRSISYIVSYDGRRGSKSFGKPLPVSLNLQHIELNAGRSSQATLLGQQELTYESLYLSPALLGRISFKTQSEDDALKQLTLFPLL